MADNIDFALNDHFYDFVDDWNYKFYFLVGGYGSSKSYHVAVKLIKKLLEEKRKALVVREVFDTIRDSCYDLLQEGRRSQVRRKSQQTKLSAGLGVIWNMPPMCTTVQEFTL